MKTSHLASGIDRRTLVAGLAVLPALSGAVLCPIGPGAGGARWLDPKRPVLIERRDAILDRNKFLGSPDRS
jgi:hypothetical protein